MEDITQVFINLYRGFPCLYDTSLSVYKSKEISKKAYLDLASSSGMSVAQVKAKIKNLRTCYTRHLWSLKEYNEKKASGLDVKPPCWRYFPDMDFLRSHCTIRRVTFAEVCGSEGETAMRFVGEVDTGTGVGETNGQAPEQMRSLEQRRLEVPTHEEKGSVLEFSPNVLRRWKAVRKARSLTTNTDTAQFLLEFFERERAKVDSRCVLCHRPLTLYCLVCDEPAPEAHNTVTSPPPQKHNTETVEKRPRRKVAQKHKKIHTKEPLRKQTVSSGKVRRNKSKDGGKESSREETVTSAEMCLVVKKEAEDGEGFDQVQLLMSVDDEADSDDSKKTSLSPPPPSQACDRLTERQQTIEDGLAETEEEEQVMEECRDRMLTSRDTCAVDVKTEESESQRVKSVDDFEPDSLKEPNSPVLSLPPTQQTTDPATATGGNGTIRSGHTKTQEHNSLGEQSGEGTNAAEDASAIVLNEGKTESQQRQPKTSAHDSSDQASKQTSSKPPGRQMQDTPGQSFPCSQCTKVFTIRKSLKQHARRHNVVHQFRCQFCSASFGHASVLKAHLRSHTGERPYACETCGKGFAAASGLKVHTIVHTGLKPCLCQVCGATFRNNSSLKTHMVRHHTKEKPFACDQCGRAFMCAPYLTRHMRIHTKERPFLCSKCGASFRCMGTLAMHVNTHQVVPPTGRKCRICGEEFSELSQLVSHNKLAHAEEKPYQCKLCGAVFAHAPSMTVHKRSHTGERPYKCKLCQAAFVCSNKLTEHMRKHTGERKMRQCTRCDRVFSSSSGFQTHLNWHAGRRPYSCDVCGRTYTKKHTLMIHIMGLTPKQSEDQQKIKSQMDQATGFLAHSVLPFFVTNQI